MAILYYIRYCTFSSCLFNTRHIWIRFCTRFRNGYVIFRLKSVFSNYSWIEFLKSWTRKTFNGRYGYGLFLHIWWIFSRSYGLHISFVASFNIRNHIIHSSILWLLFVSSSEKFIYIFPILKKYSTGKFTMASEQRSIRWSGNDFTSYCQDKQAKFWFWCIWTIKRNTRDSLWNSSLINHLYIYVFLGYER